MAIIGALPNILTNGTVADATQVMADLNAIVNSVNANAAPITSVQSASYNYAADTGTVNALIISPSSPPTVLTDGMQFRGKVANTNTSQTVTLQVGSTAAAGVVIDQAGSLPIIGSMISGMFYSFTWSAGLSKWILMNPSASSNSYTGTITGGTTSPTATITIRISADSSVCTLVPGTGLAVTSNATTCTITGGPAYIQPAQTQSFYTSLEDATAAAAGSVTMTAASGTITLGKGVSFGGGGFTASGTKAWANGSLSSAGATIIYSLK